MGLFKKKPPTPEQIAAEEAKSFFDCICPSTVKFFPHHFIVGDTYRCVWAIKEYPPSTEEQAILSHLADHSGVTMRIYNRVVDHREHDQIINHANRKNRLKLGDSNITEAVQAEQNLLDVTALLNELKRELTVMGASCEEIIALASQALTDWDEELVQKVNTIGAQIDESERTIETICMKLLLRQQPVARDLRQISAAMKMITDMERIGDQAEDIVEIVPYMNAHPDEKYPKIREMAKAAQSMVTEAVDAYVKQDLELARKVMAHDDVVDAYFTQVKSGIIDIIAAEPSQGEYALDLLMIAKYFERIGDHCTNIAEWVEFSVTGVHKDCQ